MVIGASGLAAAWVVAGLRDRIGVPSDVDDQIGSLMLMSLALLIVSLVVSLVMSLAVTTTVISGHSRPPSRGWLAIGIGFVMACVVSVRSMSHEMALGAMLPASGGVDPIVRLTGQVLHRLEPVATPFSRDRAEDDGRWRTVVRVEHATHPGLQGRRLVVGVGVADPRLVVGVKVELLGRLRPVPSAGNPGERDRRHGRRDRVPAMLIVPSGGLVEMSGDERGLSWSALIAAAEAAWADAVDRVGAAADRHQPGTRGLIAAVLRGDREELDEEITAASEDAGVAALLAISGWHLALIGTFASAMLGRHRPIGRWLAFAGTLAFAMVVIPGAGVRRAAVMVIIAGCARAAGRRARGLPVVLLAGMALVWDDPAIVERVGFRLSLIATLALVIGAGRSRSRWFGRPDRVGRARSSLIRDRFAWLSTASIVAWSSTAPIVLATFGRLSLVGVPAMIIISPVFAGFLLIAIAAAGWSLVFGECPESLARLIAHFAAAFTWIVRETAAIAPVWRCPLPPAMTGLFVIPSMALAIATGVERAVPRRLLAAFALVSTIGLIAVGSGWVNGVSGGRLRVDAIAVGDGTALLVRSAEGAVLQDAGSSSVIESGRRIIVPALRALGVRHLDAIVITHANADHYNAVIDVIRAVPVDRVVMSPHMIRRAREECSPGITSWLDRLQTLDVEITAAGRGDRLTFGDLTWSVLHPDRGERCRTVNDESIVASIGLQGDESGRARLLLCGDVQDEAIARVLAREPTLEAVVMELPHHGSWRPIAAAMLMRVDPAAVVQSTGPDRWRSDRWKQACAGRWRGVTCRDGLVSFEVDATGRVHTTGGEWSRSSDRNGSVGSEEAESGLVPAVGRSSVGARPDHHDRAVQTSTFGQHRDEHAGHAFEERGAGGDADAGLAEIERSISDGLARLEVPGHHDFGVHGGPRRVPAVGGRALVSSHRRVVQHDPVTSARWSSRFRRVVENTPHAGGLCRGGNLGRDPPGAGSSPPHRSLGAWAEVRRKDGRSGVPTR